MNRDFFNNRYGIDNLSIALIIISMLFVRYKYIWFFGVVLIGMAVFRILSKNRNKRLNELQIYNKFIYQIITFLNKIFDPLIKKIKVYYTHFKQRKYYKFLKCPECKNQLRLPKNKGMLKATCPVCKFKFLVKT